MLYKSFNERIKQTLKPVEHYIYVVHPIKQIKCTCMNIDTNQADTKCPICLGTGYKIRIKKIKAVSENTPLVSLPGRVLEQGYAQRFFIDVKYPVFTDDIFIDQGEIFLIYRADTMTGLKGEKLFQDCIGVAKRNDTAVFARNFKKILGSDYND